MSYIVRSTRRYNCEICGREIVVPGRGRPPKRCSTECRLAAKRTYNVGYFATNADALRRAARARHEANRERDNDYTRDWNRRHPGYAAQRAREWKARNPVRARELRKRWARRWWSRNAGRLNSKRRVARAANLDARRHRDRLWYRQHAEALALKARIRREGRQDVGASDRSRKRRAMKAGGGGSHTVREWREKLELFGHCCAYCGRSDVVLEREHRIPISRGGSDDISNIVPACVRCNRQKRDRTDLEFIELRRAA